jgi:hypothetical protein
MCRFPSDIIANFLLDPLADTANGEAIIIHMLRVGEKGERLWHRVAGMELCWHSLEKGSDLSGVFIQHSSGRTNIHKGTQRLSMVGIMLLSLTVSL